MVALKHRLQEIDVADGAEPQMCKLISFSGVELRRRSRGIVPFLHANSGKAGGRHFRKLEAFRVGKTS